jgi:hypothetical protein
MTELIWKKQKAESRKQKLRRAETPAHCRKEIHDHPEQGEKQKGSGRISYQPGLKV